MADSEEKNVINGRVIPMENYGTLKNQDEDRVHILEEDELVSTFKMFLFFWALILNLSQFQKERQGVHLHYNPVTSVYSYTSNILEILLYNEDSVG